MLNIVEAFRVYEHCFPDYVISEKYFTDMVNREDSLIIAKQEDDEIIGSFILVTNKNHVAALGVKPKYRHRGKGYELLKEAEKRAKEQGCDKMILGGVGDFFVDGVPTEFSNLKYFEERGYVPVGETYDMYYDVDKMGRYMPDTTLFHSAPEEAKFKIYEASEQFIKDQLWAVAKTTEEEYFDATQEEGTITFGVENNARICGFCVLSDTANRYHPYVEKYGKVGSIRGLSVIRGERLLGYGRTLAASAVICLKKKGCKGIEILGIKPDMVDFFQPIGFRVMHRMVRMEKTL